MWFKKKKDVDLRELQRKGLIRIPKEEVDLKTDRDGFVELSKEQNSPQTTDSQNSTSGYDSFSFLDSQDSSDAPQKGSDNDRELTRKLEELDNKLYKLEQRIEVLERKSGVGNFSGYSWE